MGKSILLSFFIYGSLYAGQFSFIFYNDYFAGTDEHFTNGMALNWMQDVVRSDNNSSKYTTSGLSISQILLTPANTQLQTPQYNDIPYAAHLSLSAYLFQWSAREFYEYRLEIGVLGKEAGGELVQNSFHRMIGNKTLKGWNTQLGTQYTLNALWKYGTISWQKKISRGIEMDWFHQAGFELGNFITDIFGSTMFRFGQNYNKNFNVHYPYLKEEGAFLKRSTKHKGFGWAVSSGINGQFLAYSCIIDKAQNAGYALDNNYFNASLYTGLEIYYQAHKFTFFYQSQSPYSFKQNSFDTFGGFSYSYLF
jgi:hypothetical protein